MSLSLLYRSVSFKKSLVTSGLSLLSSQRSINRVSFSSPAKKEDHHGSHAADHGHGHGDGHAPVKTHVELPEQYKHKPQEHLFKFEEGDYVPPTETHAVGDEKAEIDFGPFDDTHLAGGFGTQEKPVVVPSRYETRIVGCTGSATEEHEVLWHEVKLGRDLICMDCGQFFRLRRIPGFEHFGHHGHHEEHEFHGHVDGDGYRFMMPPKTQAEIAKEKAQRDEELKKDPKATPKKSKSTGVDYHQFGEHEDSAEEGKLASTSPIFQDRRPQILKDRK